MARRPLKPCSSMACRLAILNFCSVYYGSTDWDGRTALTPIKVYVPRCLPLDRQESTNPRREPKEKRKMCEIGKPLEIIDVEPLSLPASLRREREQPTEQPVTAEVLLSETTVERVTVTVEKL